MAARETEIESFPYIPPNRYSNEKLANELAEISIEPGEELELQILEMVEKNYIEVSNDGRFFAKKPTKSMSQLIDRIFPNMLGLNMVAYIGQMIDEVQMGRKDIDTALDQLDQMLTMQGIPLPKGEASSSKKAKQLHNDSALSAERLKSDFIKPKSLTSQLDIRKIKPKSSDVGLPFKEEPLEVGNLEEPEKQESVSSADRHGKKSSEGVLSKQTSEKTTYESSEEAAFTDEKAELDDEDIEKKISAFEQDLGMKCPLCRTGGIRPEKTTKGKLYYHCSHPTCNFISWGKPFYLSCPQCENSFLVENVDMIGKAILKCPRATCHYWQRFPWDEEEDSPNTPKKQKKWRVVKRRPRRKVRRVVRRKR